MINEMFLYNCSMFIIRVLTFVHIIIWEFKGNASEVKEYCLNEAFRAECGEDEVVVMTSAVYGLMKIGQCVVKDFGQLGCQSDQLSYLDSLCSGRQQCQLEVYDSHMQEQTPCAQGLTPYLEAGYTCQKALKLDHSTCFSNQPIHTSTVGYISSLSVQTSACGSASTPLVLQAKPGQSINISLIDFNWGGGHNVMNNQGQCDHLYGHIISYDVSDIIDLCGGRGVREQLVHLSASHRVQIALDDDAIQSTHFLITYKVIGCADFVPPKNAWVRKDSNKVTIGCHSDHKNWEMKCVGNHWIGVTENCTEVAQIQSSPVPKQAEFNQNHVFAIGTGCAALILCCVTITLGIYFIKRSKIKMTMEATYGKIKEQDNYLLPTRTNTIRTLPNADQSRRSTVLIRAKPDDSNTFNAATFRTQAIPDVQSGSLGHHRQASVPFQSNEDYVNTASCLAQEDDSVKYFVLEKPPEYKQN